MNRNECFFNSKFQGADRLAWHQFQNKNSVRYTFFQEHELSMRIHELKGVNALAYLTNN